MFNPLLRFFWHLNNLCVCSHTCTCFVSVCVHVHVCTVCMHVHVCVCVCATAGMWGWEDRKAWLWVGAALTLMSQLPWGDHTRAVPCRVPPRAIILASRLFATWWLWEQLIDQPFLWETKKLWLGRETAIQGDFCWGNGVPLFDSCLPSILSERALSKLSLNCVYTI